MSGTADRRREIRPGSQWRGAAIALLIVSACAPVAAVAEPLTTAERLSTDHAVWRAAADDFAVQRAAGTLLADEALGYADHVALLRARVEYGCRALAAQGLQPPAGVDCTGTPAVAVPERLDARTRVEQSWTLDDELGAALGEFDEMLLREQERIRAAAPRDSEQMAGGGGGGGEAGQQGSDGAEGGMEGEQASAAAGGSTAQGSASDSAEGVGAGATIIDSARGGSGGSPPEVGSQPPDDIPDGRDDDVVARQLREAAERETDPELKRRLWDEYRKYKQGTR